MMKVSVSFVSVIAHIGLLCNAQYFPTERYKHYDNILASVEDSADNLDYTKQSWNFFTASIENFDYATIQSTMSSKLSDVNVLLTGASSSQREDSWDCYINHYEDFIWSNLVADQLDDDAAVLGYDQSTWDSGGSSPIEDIAWNDLTPAQKAAAGEFCYSKLTWDKTGLTNGNVGGNPGNPDTGSSVSICFSEKNHVRALDKGIVPIHELQIGDYVLVGRAEYSRIYSFSHKDPDLKAEYLQIRAQGIKQPLEISPIHLLWVNGQMKRASEVGVGDLLLSDQEKHVTVVSIKNVWGTGAFAPVTESGEIVVNGFLVSSFVAILDHAPPIDQLKASRAFLSPLRLLCSIDFGICSRETYTNGYSDWIFSMMKIVETVNGCGPAVQALASAVALGAFTAVDTLLLLLFSPHLLTTLSVTLFWLYLKTRPVKLVLYMK